MDLCIVLLLGVQFIFLTGAVVVVVVTAVGVEVFIAPPFPLRVSIKFGGSAGGNGPCHWPSGPSDFTPSIVANLDPDFALFGCAMACHALPQKHRDDHRRPCLAC